MLPISTTYIDTHAHINFPEFRDDLANVIERAKRSGVGKMIAVGTDIETSKQVIEIARAKEGIWATVGMYPGHILNVFKEDWSLILEELDTQMKSEKVVAVGEIGLDFFRYEENKDDQVKFFRKMLDLACENDLPVIIHSRDAFGETFDILEEYRGKIRGVLHCFTGGVDEAHKVLDLGLLIGFTGLITYKHNEKILEAVAKIGLDKILIETDSPYLSPVPVRGQRNEPANVVYVAQKIAEIKNISIEMVAGRTTQNATKLFDLE